MTTAVFAGSFDPFTIGHADIVERGLAIFDRIIIAIGHNEKKPGRWSAEQRKAAIENLYRQNPKVQVEIYTCLTSEFAKLKQADALLRSVRNATDFAYEQNLADINMQIFGLETVILMARPDLSFVSSSMIRELEDFGHDASKYVAAKLPDNHHL